MRKSGMNLFKGPSRHDAKISEADAEINKKTWNLMTDRKIVYDYIEPECKEYFKSDSYKNGETDTKGYNVCCDVLEMCGMSGWTIFLIILIVLLCLAGAAAAFWFFYYKRKMGGRDEEKEIESTADNTGHDISVETY
ncbi:hypothetical protein GCK72_007764 [Caenorhabditis remanei]|uniref:Uncharacterized protein n=1 Tax=Caenorhabditis remanei TaxID=31234 RepID=A0A6A5HJX7_CAERE|nr:hypothetical protein GCK72_007764 [Caenorhabditis remanei]KAF1767805.1 hypothetical protein GCK72_007764 [Caenorhabditis remanei]